MVSPKSKGLVCLSMAVLSIPDLYFCKGAHASSLIAAHIFSGCYIMLGKYCGMLLHIRPTKMYNAVGKRMPD